MNSNTAVRSHGIETGDWVGSAWASSPKWTPYAQAIAAHYPIQVPWYSTHSVTPSVLTTVPTAVVTRPNLYDVLIIGASAFVVSAGDPTLSQIGLYGLQVTHQETGIPWAAPNTIGFSPVASFSGINLNPTPIIKLPEAFFLPAKTRLKIEWVKLTDATPSSYTIVFTFVGVQLINYKQDFQAPQWVTMPNGDTIPVGSRLPWFGTIPFGSRNAAGRAFGAYSLNQGQQVVQFLPPSDCSVEIHDAYTNVETGSTFGDTPILLTMKITDMRAVSDWTPGLTPVTAVFGNETQVYPVLPFTKPHLLRVGHRTAITMQNNSTAVQALSGTITLRGVRLCEY